MGILNLFKKPKYDFSKEEVDRIVENAVIPEHARAKTQTQTVVQQKPVRLQPKPIIVVPGTKSIFFVENSYKMMENFMLNGYTRSGTIKRNMRTQFNDETLMVTGLQQGFKRATKILAGERGSIEIKARHGFAVPDNSELEFSYKTKGKKRKRAKTSAKKSIKPKTRREPVFILPEAIPSDEIAEDLLREETAYIRGVQ